jgi:hypothetical protein
VICQARFHRRGDAQTQVHATEIVVREMDSDSSFQVLQFLRESIRKAREAPKRQSHREVLAFDVTGRDVRLARISDSHLGYNLDHWAWGVPFSSVLAVIAIQPRQLGEVHVEAKGFLNHFRVEVESVSG